MVVIALAISIGLSSTAPPIINTIIDTSAAHTGARFSMSFFNAARLSDTIQANFGCRPRQFQIAATRSICEGKDTVVICPNWVRQVIAV